ncbi:MAG: RagB/SusD family nutrient uptake outer membrane protein [Prevotella sp.]|nr:RagB/SusD family nutrient uptake outer membrane protein [Prevotella sp.]
MCCAICLTGALTACSDMLDTDSELVEFQEDNQLNSPTDSVYSVMGIIYKLQTLADRTVLLGEVRADLVAPTEYANADLKALAGFDDSGTQNRYNQISDYYAVVNNCNYYLATVDTALQKRGQRVFEAEYAAVKAFRAWTYLQMAKVYGSVPLVTEPLLTEREAEDAMMLQPQSIVQICNYFIDDLRPYVDTKLPQYGNINNQSSQKFFIPVRALLGDLCLWAGRYQEAATYYHDYLTLRTNPITTGTSRAQWSSQTNDFRTVYRSFSSTLSSSSQSECLAYVPMESSEYEGVYSQLANTFNSTLTNNYYAQVSPSKALMALSASQNYCMLYRTSDSQIDTLYAPKQNLLEPYQEGDLRLYDYYRWSVVNQDQNSKYSAQRQTINKLNADGVTLYRRNVVYLHFAEALNCAGYPQSAFAVLKYGLYDQVIRERIDSIERAQAGDLLAFDVNVFSEQNMQGVHSRGCGDADADPLYTLPMPAQSLASRADTVAWQQPLVEDYIVNELALETAFEGQRYYDLMRIALRRNDPAYLAAPIARRNGETDMTLYSKLLDSTNWYLRK